MKVGIKESCYADRLTLRGKVLLEVKVIKITSADGGIEFIPSVHKLKEDIGFLIKSNITSFISVQEVQRRY